MRVQGLPDISSLVTYAACDWRAWAFRKAAGTSLHLRALAWRARQRHLNLSMRYARAARIGTTLPLDLRNPSR